MTSWRKRKSRDAARGSGVNASDDLIPASYLEFARNRGKSDAVHLLFQPGTALGGGSLGQAAWERSKELVCAEYAPARQRCQTLRTQVEEIEADLKSTSCALRECEADKTTNPGMYNSFVGYLLVTVAFLLFISDIPISLLLVGKGLELPTEARQIVFEPTQDSHTSGKTPPISQYVRRNLRSEDKEAKQAWNEAQEAGQVITVTDIFRAPWTAFTEFWDVYALALGLAFLGFAMKPMLDVLLDRVRFFPDKRWSPMLIVLAAGTAFLLTCVTLGYFRGSVLTEDRLAAVNTRMQESEAKVKKMSNRAKLAGSDLSSDIEAEKKRQEDITNKDMVAVTKDKPLAVLTYIAITVALPLIGGVCFYFGFQRLDRARALSALSEEREKRRNLRETTLEQLSSAEVDKNRIEARMAHVEGQLAAQMFVDECQSAYQGSISSERRKLAEELSRLSLFERMRLNQEVVLMRERLEG
jgi:hypothetical protein